MFPVVDGRSDTRRCGVERTEEWVESNALRCEPAPAAWLGLLVLNALHDAGFEIVTTETSKSPDPLQLRIKLERFFADQVGGGRLHSDFQMDVHYTVHASTASGLSARRSFFYSGRDHHLFTTDESHKALAKPAQEDVAKSIVLAVVELLRRYESIGVVR